MPKRAASTSQGAGRLSGHRRLLGTLPGKLPGSWDTLRVRPAEGPEPRWEPAVGSSLGSLCGPGALRHPSSLAHSPPLLALGENRAKAASLSGACCGRKTLVHPQGGHPGCTGCQARPHPRLPARSEATCLGPTQGERQEGAAWGLGGWGPQSRALRNLP